MGGEAGKGVGMGVIAEFSLVTVFLMNSSSFLSDHFRDVNQFSLISPTSLRYVLPSCV